MISILIIRRIPIFAVGALIVVAMSACGDNSDVGEGGLTIVATTTILGDIVQEVVGDQAEVIVVLPAGADPHEVQPSSRDIVQLNGAQLVVANGLGLEIGLLPALMAAKADGVNVVELGPEVDPLQLDGGADDPHFWMDPLRVVVAVRFLAGELERIDGSVDWMTSAATYIESLEAGHEQIVEILRAVEDRELVTNHDALGYFAARYGFEIAGTVIPGGTTLGDPSSSQLAALVKTIEQLDPPAIFAETTEPAELARAIVDEVGRDIDVVELFTESFGEPGSEAGTLIGMLIADAELIAEALTE